MKDTIIKGTGNSRTLKSVANFLTLYPTYEAFAQAIIEGTLPIDIGPLKPDGIVQAGDPLNKATLLSDETAALYGKDGTAVPDDILAAIPMSVNAGWKLLQEWTVAGTYTWTAPDLFGGEDYEIGVLVIGAGGSGAAVSQSTSSSSSPAVSGGASGGSIVFIMTVKPNVNYNVVVGNGGTMVTANSSNSAVQGNNGESSAFDGKTAQGGNGGTTGSFRTGSTNYSNPVGVPGIVGVEGLFGGTVLVYDSYAGSPAMCFNPFENERILGSGGGASGFSGEKTGGKNPLTGLGGGNGKRSINDNCYNYNNGEEPGCGGGGALVRNDNGVKNYVAISAAGADGAVKLYIRRIAA